MIKIFHQTALIYDVFTVVRRFARFARNRRVTNVSSRFSLAVDRWSQVDWWDRYICHRCNIHHRGLVRRPTGERRKSTMAMRSERDAVSVSSSSSSCVSSSLPRDLGRRRSVELLRKLHADLALFPTTSSDNSRQTRYTAWKGKHTCR